MSQSGLPARRSALYLVDQITLQGKLMAELMSAGALDRLGPEDRARAQRLATQMLRHLGRADRVLDKFLSKKPAGSVSNILRLATIEICGGGAPHGVVNDWVEICARGKKSAGMKALVNAVLRKVAREGPDLWAKAGPSRMPKWLRAPLAVAWGRAAMAGMEAAHEAGAPLDITPRDPGQGEALAERLGAALLPTGSLRLNEPGQISALPGFAEGQWWVQDAAAALPAQILAARAGESVLDLCAAPGGKTMQLAASGAKVVAVDDSEVRLGRLRDNLSRTGLNAQVVCADVMGLAQKADAILLDAPCSATGTLRRHPDLPFAKDGSEFAGLIALQARMLDHALTLLRPGGRLVYCTCSLLPDEGEVQIEAALARHKGLRVDRQALLRPGVDPAWISEEGGLRLRPDFWAERGGMDGFYIACLRYD